MRVNWALFALLVTACCLLPSLADEGEGPTGKILVTSKLIDSAVDDIKWTGQKKEVVFVKTTKGTLYRSSDFGRTWSRQNSLLTATAGVNEGGTEDVGVVHSLQVSPANPDHLIVIGTKGTHWASTDSGLNYRAITQKKKVHEVVMHPTEAHWLLAATHSEGCADPSDVDGYCFKELHLSRDFGEEWELLATYVVQFAWAQGKSAPKERILLTHFPQGKRDQKEAGWHVEVELVSSDDFFGSHRLLVPHGNRFLFSNDFLFVAQANVQKPGEVQLVVSSDGGSTFKLATLPFKVQQHSYTVLDTSQGSVFLHVNRHGPTSAIGDVYVSDSTGTRFSLTLPNNVRNTEGQCDFDKVQGLEGIYIANLVFDKELESEEEDTEDWSKSDSRRRGSRGKKKSKKDQVTHTAISFDKGGSWSALRAPEVDSQGKSVDCGSRCSLHLHGLTVREFGPFYSTSSAPGLVMGTGNIGEHLYSRSDEVNTYLSRDGGLSWVEVRKGSYIYELGDHGGLMVMADDQKATKEVVFSWNEGLTWETFEFATQPIEVDNIVIEPDAISQVFLLYGTKGDEGVIYQLDFKNLHKPRCQGEDAPGSPDSDYELWSPSDGRLGSKCLMGRQVTYVRRKRDRACYNGVEFERSEFVKNCECTEADWECDVGYQRKDITDPNSPCVPMKSTAGAALLAAEQQIPDVCPSGQFFEVSNGYRKVAGDSCVDGLQHQTRMLACPITGVSHTGMSILVVLLVIVVLLGAATFVSRSEKFRHWFGNIGIQRSSKHNVAYSGLANIPDRAETDEEYGLDEDREAELLNDQAVQEKVMLSYTQTQKEKDKDSQPRRGLELTNQRVPTLRPPPGKRITDDL